MRIKATLITLLVYSLSFPSWAEAAKEPQGESPAPATSGAPTTTTPAAPKTSSKQAWLDKMKQGLPPALCKKEQYFVNCFKVTENECMDFTKIVVDACLNNIKLALPAQIGAQEGEHWGQMVGRCTFDLYEKFMQPKKYTQSEKKECYITPQQSDASKPIQGKP